MELVHYQRLVCFLWIRAVVDVFLSFFYFFKAYDVSDALPGEKWNQLADDDDDSRCKTHQT